MRLIVEPFLQHKSNLTGFMRHLDADGANGWGKWPFLMFIGDEDLWFQLQHFSRNEKIEILWVSGPNPPNMPWNDVAVSYVTNLYEEGRNDEGIGGADPKMFTPLHDLLPHIANNTNPELDELKGIQYIHPNIFFTALQELQEVSGGAYKIRDGENMIFDTNGAGAFIVNPVMAGAYEDLETDQEKLSFLEETFNLMRSELERDFYLCYLVE